MTCRPSGLLLVVLLAACGKQTESTGTAGSGQPASATAPVGSSAAAPPVGSAAAPPLAAAEVPTDGCAASCERRQDCAASKDNTADCIRDCNELVAMEALTPEGVSQYAKSECPAVLQAEADVHAGFACVRGCRKVLACGVEGEMRACMGLCAANLQKGAYDVAALEKMTASDCDTIRANVTLDPPPATAAPSNPGQGCRRNGAQDCGSVWVCCRRGRVTREGDGGGLCLSQGGCALEAMAHGR